MIVLIDFQSIQSDVPQTSISPLPRPKNQLFSKIHRLLRPLTKAAQIGKIIPLMHFFNHLIV